MTLTAGYDALSRLCDYPEDRSRVLEDSVLVEDFMRERGLAASLADFADFASSSSLAALQEEYVGTFDFNPATAPYLGHHLFGDNQKKGSYMMLLKREYSRWGYQPAGTELVDHLSVVLGFLAHLSRQTGTEDSRSLVAVQILPGIERMGAAFDAKKGVRWKCLIEASRTLCAEGLREVVTC
ncbi:MAG: nitrate reductase molybdenum cofactor assembly chaperone [Spirochaetota bacterium]